MRRYSRLRVWLDSVIWARWQLVLTASASRYSCQSGHSGQTTRKRRAKLKEAGAEVQAIGSSCSIRGSCRAPPSREPVICVAPVKWEDEEAGGASDTVLLWLPLIVFVHLLVGDDWRCVDSAPRNISETKLGQGKFAPFAWRPFQKYIGKQQTTRVGVGTVSSGGIHLPCSRSLSLLSLKRALPCSVWRKQASRLDEEDATQPPSPPPPKQPLPHTRYTNRTQLTIAFTHFPPFFVLPAHPPTPVKNNHYNKQTKLSSSRGPSKPLHPRFLASSHPCTLPSLRFSLLPPHPP